MKRCFLLFPRKNSNLCMTRPVDTQKMDSLKAQYLPLIQTLENTFEDRLKTVVLFGSHSPEGDIFCP